MSQEYVAAGVDVGSAVTRCVICHYQKDRFRLLGYGESPSRGWTRSRLTDHLAAAESIREAVAEAERRAQVSLEGAVAGIGGPGLEAMHSRGLYEFGRPRPIEAGDLSFAAELASRVPLAEDRQILHVLVQDFTVDGRAGFRKPRGIAASRLEANVLVLAVGAHEHQSLIAAMHQAHLAVEETVFEGLAAAYATILPEERARGAALVDIGAHSTNICIYDGDALVHACSLPLSGDHHTRDVAVGLCVSYEDAELLKREYGCALTALSSERALIELPTPDGRPPRESTRWHLNQILEARAEQLFEYVRREIVKAGMEQSLLEGVVLTGGGALLQGMCDVAEKVLRCQARNGLPVGIADWPDELRSPAWSTGAGLAMYSARLKSRMDWKPKAPGLINLIFK